jgi:hypothetical protein
MKSIGKEESNSHKYDGMIAITPECNDFFDTYEVIAALFI